MNKTLLYSNLTKTANLPLVLNYWLCIAHIKFTNIYPSVSTSQKSIYFFSDVGFTDNDNEFSNGTYAIEFGSLFNNKVENNTLYLNGTAVNNKYVHIDIYGIIKK